MPEPLSMRAAGRHEHGIVLDVAAHFLLRAVKAFRENARTLKGSRSQFLLLIAYAQQVMSMLHLLTQPPVRL